ncbi:hypothetical protein OIU84_028271 [Salix udensis]|uniref:Uncharacterized protein n=1 Tax=Salix udensis TaxID=889485 RepID=A0AAD6KC78_9ROSI|nr:hypothetical protein OIU84_028271 [Salix udensis]
MAAIAKLSVVVSMILFFDNVLARTSEPATIGASPAVLPYVTAPNMSSFFPPQTNEWDLVPAAAPPRLEELAPVSSSGEFIGKSSSSTQQCSTVVSPPYLVLLLRFLQFSYMNW